MKKLYKLLMIFVLLFMFAGVANADPISEVGETVVEAAEAESYREIYNRIKAGTATFDECTESGMSKIDCIKACELDPVEVTISASELALSSLRSTMPAEDIINDIEEFRIDDHTFTLSATDRLNQMEADLSAYAETLSDGTHTIYISYIKSIQNPITTGPHPTPPPTATSNAYSITSGANQTFVKNKPNEPSIVIVTNGNYADVTAVQISRSGTSFTNIDPNGQGNLKNYTLSGDSTSTTLTLKSIYLNQQTAEAKIIKILYSDGGYVEANLTINEYITVSKTFTINKVEESESANSGKCYVYFHEETAFKPAYFTTTWANFKPACGFRDTNWSYSTCKDGRISNAFDFKVSDRTYHIAHSGYNGVADFYDFTERTEEEAACNNFGALHIVYRVITIVAPIIAILFITYDFVKCIVSGDPNKIAGFRKKAIRRIIALLILVLLPILVSIIVHTLSKNNKIATDSWIKCMITGEGVGTNTSDTTQSSTTTTASKIADSNKTTNKTTNNTNKTTTNSNKTANNTNKTTTNSNKTTNNTNKTSNKTTQTTTTTTNSTSPNKAKRTAIANAAKEVKEYTKKNGFRWCARGNNKCQTKKIEDAISSRNKQKKISCATLANAAIYKAGIYSASDINGHSINNSRSTATYLRDKGWTLITDPKKLEAGDIVFYYRANKTLITIPGMSKPQSIGHVEVYAGNNKVYNSGSDYALRQITTGFSSGSFRFAYRYPGN